MSLIDLMSSMSRSATLCISCSLLTPMEESSASTCVPPHKNYVAVGHLRAGLEVDLSLIKLLGQDVFDVV